MKECTKCGEEFPNTNEYFSRQKKGKNGLSASCKKCRSMSFKNWRKNNKEKIWENHLKYIYGITLKDWNKMFQEQEGKCAICGVHQSEMKHVLYVDHDHKTDKVRGLLCARCNTGIGFFEDKKFMEKANNYLKS